jgi:hypothetical protein
MSAAHRVLDIHGLTVKGEGVHHPAQLNDEEDLRVVVPETLVR